MQGQLEFSFSDLKCKLVINVTDGKILGNIIDVIFFPQTGKILGFVVPGAKKSFFKTCENIFIPYNCVCKVGIDVILVELFVDSPPCCPPNNKSNKFINILDDNKNQSQIYENKNIKTQNSFSQNDCRSTENNYEEDDKIPLIDPNIYPK